MSQFISDFLTGLVDIVWGLPLIILLIGGGAFLLISSHLLPLKGFIHAFRLIAGKVHHDGAAEGQLSHFQALMNALSATVGMGNISGVAIAIVQGGPGAVFWMWLAAVVGMVTKFFECSLSVMYRGKDFTGEVQGGPMYVVQSAMGKSWQPLGVAFAVFGVIGTLPMFQVNQLASFVNSEYQLPMWSIGLASSLFVAFVLAGGVLRLAHVSSALVPFMGVVYFIACSAIVAMNFEWVPTLLGSIFQHAFTGEAAIGGALGIGVREIMKQGVRRAAFSNEAGIGTAPMAHSNAKTSEPISEGLVAMLGPFFDTIIICTLTALVILLSIAHGGGAEGQSGVLLTKQAFDKFLPGGGYLLGVAILLFSVTTMIGLSNYNKKCWDFLFRGRWHLGEKTYIAFFAIMIFVGSITTMDDIINLMDACYGLMAVPNMIITLTMAGKVKEQFLLYRDKYM